MAITPVTFIKPSPKERAIELSPRFRGKKKRVNRRYPASRDSNRGYEIAVGRRRGVAVEYAVWDWI